MKNENLQRGVTLIELMTSMVIASVVLFSVFFIWNYINMHVVKSENRTRLEKETNRIGNQIASHIRKSTQIINWNATRVEMIEQGTDTLIYCLSDSQLLMNGKPIYLLLPDAKVNNFELKSLNDNFSGSTGSLLLNMTIAIRNKVGDACSTHFTIQLSKKENKNESENNWGF